MSKNFQGGGGGGPKIFEFQELMKGCPFVLKKCGYSALNFSVKTFFIIISKPRRGGGVK